MQQLSIKSATLLFSILLSSVSLAETFSLSSTDITEGKPMDKRHEFQGFGCNGSNLSPQLSWQGVPEETKAFAVLAYDPDAPTGSGWWHWQIVNIPVSVTSLNTGAGNTTKNQAPKGSVQMINDYGSRGFGGACPPAGHGEHRYQFTLHALSKALELPEDASGALTGYMVNAHSLASSTIEAKYER